MIELVVDTKACKGKNNEINYIEHVQAYISKTKFEKLTINSTLRHSVNATWRH